VWPAAADKEACRRHMLQLYAEARALPMKNCMLFSKMFAEGGGNLLKGKKECVPGYDGFLSPEDLAKRLGGAVQVDLALTPD